MQIVEDLTNGVPPSGVDGRQRMYNHGSQRQGVFTNRGAAVPGSGYRISSSGDTADASAAGGISVNQPFLPFGLMDSYEGDFGELPWVAAYRFNLTVSCLTPGSARQFEIDTPLGRVNSLATYYDWSSPISFEFKSQAEIDGLSLTATWVPAPSPFALLGLGLLISRRRRR